MIYLWIFIGLTLACIGLGIANAVVKHLKNKREDLTKGD